MMPQRKQPSDTTPALSPRETKSRSQSSRDPYTGRSAGMDAHSPRGPASSDSARLLKELRLASGLSVRAMAKRLEMSPTTYQHYETRYKKPFLPYELIERAKPILLDQGVEPDRLEALTPQISNLTDDVSGILKAPLISWVQAGAFEEAVDPYALGGFEEEVVVEYERESVIALRVRGTSINRVAPDNAVIIVDYALRELVPEKFFVIKVSGEATVKRFMMNPDRFEPFSTEPDHPIILPTEDFDIVGRVVRVVTAL